ncbi:HNH endonuclease [Agrobacterium cavarae]|uniref:HNH endonuclease n=1 Tax=Agrobacterium cavarae TaxID=2528239 RepID=UPI000DD7B53F
MDTSTTSPAKKVQKQVRRFEVPRTLIFARDVHQCPKCAATDNLSIDHIVPVSRGGAHAESNLQTLCLSCNARNGARHEPGKPVDETA